MQDLNKQTQLPLSNDMFDFVTCTVSIDYLVKPVEVLRQALRVLKPSGTAVIVISNRMFGSKVIRWWRTATDRRRVWAVMVFLRFAATADAWFEDLSVEDLSPSPGDTDPLYAITAKKKINS